MKKKALFLLLGIFLILTPVLASANNIDGNCFSATWDEFTYFQPGSPNVFADFQTQDPLTFGAAVLSSNPESVIANANKGLGLLALNTSEGSEADGFFSLLVKLPNFITNNPVKNFEINVRYSNNYSFVSPDIVDLLPEGTLWSWSTYWNTEPDGGYKLTTITGHIWPNPWYETFVLYFEGDCVMNLDYITVTTCCVPVPPSLLLLGSGLLGLIGWRRIRQG